MLIAKGAEVDSTEANGQTPLVYAAANGHYEVVELLLKSGASRALDASLIVAASNCHDNVVEQPGVARHRAQHEGRGRPDARYRRGWRRLRFDHQMAHPKAPTPARRTSRE